MVTTAQRGPAPPEARPRARWAPTPRLAIILAALAVLNVAVTLPGQGWALVAADLVVAIFVVADARTLPRPQDVTGERRRARVFSLRVPTPVEVTVHNAGRLRLHGSIRMPLPGALRADTDTLPLVVPPRGDATATFSVRGRRRGRHKCPPVVFQARSPLGLVRRMYPLAGPDEVPVYPNLHAAARLELLARRRREDLGMRRARLLGLGTDFESLREYRPDDDFRVIDWHATARKGIPIARQFRVERNQNVLFVIDSGRLMAAPIGHEDDGPEAAADPAGGDAGLTRLDLAMNAATAMAQVCAAFEDRVGTIIFDNRVRYELRPARAQTDVVLAAMCATEARRVESDYALAFRIAGGMKRSLVVLFTDLFEDAAARPLLDATPSLTSRHLVVVASVVDVEVTALANDEPVDAAGAFRQAVAVDVLRRRAAVAARLRALGVEVVEAPPAGFSPALVEAYLRLKATGRL